MNNFQFNIVDVFKINKDEFKENLPMFFFTLLLITIPLNHLVNSFLLVLFFLYSLFTTKLKNFQINKTIILAIIFYLLMVVSWFWSIDKPATIKSIIKELPLLIIPFVFLLNKDFLVTKKNVILKFYSYSIVVYSIFFLFKAIYNFIIYDDISVFFFHDLVTKDLNAVHFSAVAVKRLTVESTISNWRDFR